MGRGAWGWNINLQVMAYLDYSNIASCVTILVSSGSKGAGGLGTFNCATCIIRSHFRYQRAGLGIRSAGALASVEVFSSFPLYSYLR